MFHGKVEVFLLKKLEPIHLMVSNMECIIMVPLKLTIEMNEIPSDNQRVSSFDLSPKNTSYPTILIPMTIPIGIPGNLHEHSKLGRLPRLRTLFCATVYKQDLDGHVTVMALYQL